MLVLFVLYQLFRGLFVARLVLVTENLALRQQLLFHPSALWTAQQIIEAFPEEPAPRFLLRDRDQIYGEHFRVGLWEWAFKKS